MNIKPNILQYPLLLTVFLFAFKKSEKTIIQSGSRSVYGIQKQMKSDSGGRTVNLDSAQVCINRYTALMQAHGFSDPGGKNVNIRIKKTDQLTTGEAFDGKSLQDWLNNTAAAYQQAGKTLMIKIQMGVYDMNYLNTYQPNPNARMKDNNRVAIFLVPYDGATGQPVRALGIQPSGGTGTGGGTGYDLGGLQP